MELYLHLFITLCYVCNICSSFDYVKLHHNSYYFKPHMFNGNYIKWKNKSDKDFYVENRDYIPKSIIFTRFQIYGNQVFLISPRYKEGVPFTLSHVRLNSGNQCYNYVAPYPTLEINYINDRNSIINAVDIYMGQNRVLWVLDIGIVNTLGEEPKRECEAKVLGIDYGNKRVLHIIPLHALICHSRTQLEYLIVEYVNNSNHNPVIYIGDGGTGSIIVWNVRGKEGYRVKLPRCATITSSWSDEKDHFFLVLIENNKSNYIYFTYSSSRNMFKVHTRDLRSRIDPRCVVNIGRKPSEMVLLGSGYGSIIYFRIKGLNHLYSWDTNDGFLEENIMLVKKSVDCRTITHIDVDNDGVLWEIKSDINDYVVSKVGNYGANILIQPIFEKPIPLPNN